MGGTSLAPWKYIPQRKLQDAWKRFGGGILWVERVGCEIGVEAAKSRQRIANYMGKWDQMVRAGRGVTYSRGWPKLPVEPIGERRGDIYWTWIHACTEEAAFFWNDRESGNWMEVAPNEWGRAHGEKCNCFQRIDKPVYGQSRDPPAHLPDSDLDGCYEWLASINQVVANIIKSRRESHEPELNDLDEVYRAYCERNEVPFDPDEIWRYGVAEAADHL
ncbi:MAG: hypothetical protein GY845_25405 [Planctomycetes bacterium]|nr:hypothetical protein [Planctomycetota bacterium]